MGFIFIGFVFICPQMPAGAFTGDLAGALPASDAGGASAPLGHEHWGFSRIISTDEIPRVTSLQNRRAGFEQREQMPASQSRNFTWATRRR